MGISREATFKLVGVMNMFGNIPDFVWPVYESKDGQLFFSEGREKDCTIDGFKKVKPSALQVVRLFKDGLSTNQFELQEVTIGSKFIFAFQTSEDAVQLGDYQQMKQYLEDFETEDEILKTEITDFLEGRLE